MTKSQVNLVAALVIVVGILALVAGIIWFTVEAKSLPSFMGQIHGATLHRTKRGTVAVIVGAVLLLVGGGMLFYKPRRAA